MTQVTFYDNNSEKGSSETYTGAQARSSGVMSGIDSLTTGDNTWLIVYDSNDYSGNALRFGPNSSNDDLNKTQRGSSGDWKNQIASFVMYDHEPSFWASGSTTAKPDLLTGQALFCEDEQLSGDNRIFADSTVDDMNTVYYSTDSSRDMKDNISSLATGPNTYLQIFDETDRTGNTLRVYPNTTYSDLNDVARGDGDWKNQIQSFWVQTSDSTPMSWVLTVDLSKFRSLYPDNYDDSTTSGNAFGYQTQDAQYRIYFPVLQSLDAFNLTVVVQIDHIISGATDDHAVITMTFDSEGLLTQVSGTWDAGSAYQIPNWLVKGVDVSAKVLGALGAFESGFISEEAADEFVEAFDIACKAFDAVFNIISSISESDGGRFYMIPVVCHTIFRVCASITDSES